MRIFIVVISIALLLLLGSSCLFTVDQSEYVYVTQFGRHVATYDGGRKDTDAGLHLKWPWPIQTLQRLDRRLQHYDLPAAELLTYDRDANSIEKTLTGEAYVCWRIAGKGAVDAFIRRLGTMERAQAVLRDQITSKLGELIGQMRMADLVQADPVRVEEKMEGLRQSLLEHFQKTHDSRQEYGVEVVDIRLRRLNHPIEVHPEIHARIRSERGILVKQHETEGNRMSARIKSRADQKARAILSRANARKVRLEGEADAEADRIRNVAQSKDPEFYEFLKKLEASKLIFGNDKTTLFLSTQHKLFEEMFKPPGKKPASPPPTLPAQSGGP